MIDNEKKNIVIIAHHTDVHAKAVAREIALIGNNSIIIDTSEFPQFLSLSNKFSNDKHSCLLKISEGLEIDFHKVHSIWWRRPQKYTIDENTKHPSVRNFVYTECIQAFKGTMISLNSRIKFLNPIVNGEEASFKLYQLSLAKDIGLKIPNTIITNNPQEALKFIDENNNDCIYKPFNGVNFGPWETRPLKAIDVEEIDKIKECPFILQQHIHGDFDVRVTIVGEEIFTAKLLFKEGKHPVDSRSDIVPVMDHTLDDRTTKQLLLLMKKLGLFYGAIDLRYSNDNGYTFFEINPEGQYLWIEIETGLPISKSIANFLSK